MARRETFEDIGQPARRIKSVELGGSEQALDGGGAAARPFRADKQTLRRQSRRRWEYAYGRNETATFGEWGSSGIITTRARATISGV